MAERKPISKKLRFEIFKRDFFKCQYCGSAPPTVVLEIDHIIPVSKGGGNQSDNLLTACFDCNRGKSDRSLSVSPDTLIEKAAILEEKRAQLKAFERLQKKIRQEQDRHIEEIEEVFCSAFPNKQFTEKFRLDIRRHFLSRLPPSKIVEAMEITISRVRDPNHATTYFCKVCWNFIKE